MLVERNSRLVERISTVSISYICLRAYARILFDILTSSLNCRAGMIRTSMETVMSNGSAFNFKRHRQLKEQLQLHRSKRSFFGVNDLSVLTTRQVGGVGGLDVYPSHWSHGTRDRYVYDPGLIGASAMRAQDGLGGHIHRDTGQLQF